MSGAEKRRQLRASLTEALRKVMPGEEWRAEILAELAHAVVMELLAGEVVSFPALSTLRRAQRDMSIREEFRRGATYQVIGRRYRIGTRHVRRLVTMKKVA